MDLLRQKWWLWKMVTVSVMSWYWAHFLRSSLQTINEIVCLRWREWPTRDCCYRSRAICQCQLATADISNWIIDHINHCKMRKCQKLDIKSIQPDCLTLKNTWNEINILWINSANRLQLCLAFFFQLNIRFRKALLGSLCARVELIPILSALCVDCGIQIYTPHQD